jgi:hypothetical protein
MNNWAEGFKTKALKYERAAEVATDAEAGRMYLDLARQLRVMAERAEALEADPSSAAGNLVAGSKLPRLGVRSRWPRSKLPPLDKRICVRLLSP